MAICNAVPAAVLNSSVRSSGNTRNALRMFLPVALKGWRARATRLQTETHERDEVSTVLWVAAPREPSRRPGNDAPEVVSFDGLSSKTRRPYPWQNLHIECFAQHPVQMVDCPGGSLARKSSSWHIVENPYVSWWNVMGTTCTEARPAAPSQHSRDGRLLQACR